MARHTKADPVPAENLDPAADPLLVDADDPGGAHRKGYVAETGAARAAPDEGPIPLADDADVTGHVSRPDGDQ